MTELSDQEMRAAIAARDASYDGRFFFAVFTTGVFCKPSCPSRPARHENLRFFANSESAIAAGFRPCKRCQPISRSPHLDQLVKIARFIESHAQEQLTLLTLAERAGVSASHLQRTFKNVFGVSPKVYQDAVRTRHLKQSLKEGESITDAIYSSGYGSLSRFYGEASRSIGMTPKAYRSGGDGEVIYFALKQSILGLIAMAATKKGICFVQFGDDESSLHRQLQTEFPKAKLVPSPAQHSSELEIWMLALNNYMEKGNTLPNLPLDLRGTAFQVKVWRFLISIKEGEVRSYSEVAKEIGSPKAIRATASACAKNRIAVLIPCHRVLRADGSLGGYKWGLERKRTLLDAERSRR